MQTYRIRAHYTRVETSYRFSHDLQRRGSLAGGSRDRNRPRAVRNSRQVLPATRRNFTSIDVSAARTNCDATCRQRHVTARQCSERRHLVFNYTSIPTCGVAKRIYDIRSGTRLGVYSWEHGRLFQQHMGRIRINVTLYKLT